MSGIVSRILDYLVDNEKDVGFRFTLTQSQVDELENVRDAFCSRVGEIIGSCKMDMEDCVDGTVQLIIRKTK